MCPYVCIALHGFQLLRTEQAVSMTSCTLGAPDDAKSTYYIVGTAFVNPNEKEPKQGRILVLKVTASKHPACLPPSLLPSLPPSLPHTSYIADMLSLL